MPKMYDLNLDSPSAPNQPSKKGGLGCALFGWLMFGVVALFLLSVGYRTFVYYGQLRNGQIVELPQYGDRLSLTAAGNAPAGATLEATRANVESETSASFGADAAEAKLVIVEFADFECPYSKDESGVVRRLMQKYGDRVRFEFRDYPLEEIHHSATEAALAARCAQEQGKFWTYHDKLFGISPVLGTSELTALAVQTGFDENQFSRCLNDGRYRAQVDADRNAAQQLGLVGTPTFFLNGRRIDGAIPEDVFEGLIQQMLK